MKYMFIACLLLLSGCVVDAGVSVPTPYYGGVYATPYYRPYVSQPYYHPYDHPYYHPYYNHWR